MENKKKDIYEKLKELFSLATAPKVEAIIEEKFEDVKLKDGSSLRGDLKAGSKLSLVGADGTVSDAPDGEHELEDGRKVVIKEGVVDSIADAVIEEAPVKEDVKVEDAPVVEPEVETPADTEVEDMLPQIVADLAARLGAVEAALGEYKTANTEMAKQLEKFAKQPATEPIKRTAVADSYITKNNNILSKIGELSSLRIK